VLAGRLHPLPARRWHRRRDLCFIDDHSRYAISLTAHQPVTGPIVVDVFRHAVARHGPPASTLTDIGMVFTTRLSGGRGRNGFESELHRLGITQKNSAPGHPTTCGKVCEDLGVGAVSAPV
jgi:transposase InsO family protein